MARAGRIVCVSIPFLLTLGCFACLLLAFLGQINAEDSSIERPFYFLRMNTSIFGAASDVASTLNIDTGVEVSDWYTIGLWNYCSGEDDVSTSVPTYCSPRRAFFWFNPLQVWGLEDTPIAALVPAEWSDALDVYQTASKWMFIAYLVAIIAALVTVVLALFAFCGRLGSLFTTLTAGVAAVFSIGASATASVIFNTLKGVLDEKLGEYGVETGLGTSIFVVTWIAAAFAVVSLVFWIGSICCCSGRDKHHSEKAVRPETRRTGTFGYGGDSYQRVPSPYKSGNTPHVESGRWYADQGVYGHKNAAYEPYRNEV